MPEVNSEASVNALRLENERLKSDLKYFEKQYRLLEAFMNSAPFVVYIKNRQREYAFFNPVRQRQLGLKPDDILWHTDLDLVGTHWGFLAHEQDGKVLTTREAAEALECAPGIDEGNGNWLVVRFPFTGPDGEPRIGVVGLDTSRQVLPSKRLP
jgi:PAS domain-containing protein